MSVNLRPPWEKYATKNCEVRSGARTWKISRGVCRGHVVINERQYRLRLPRTGVPIFTEV